MNMCHTRYHTNVSLFLAVPRWPKEMKRRRRLAKEMRREQRRLKREEHERVRQELAEADSWHDAIGHLIEVRRAS